MTSKFSYKLAFINT